MYCPKCGKENPEKQRFCTACGLRLENVAQALTNESALTGQDRFIATLRGGNKGRQDPLTFAFVLIAAGILIGAIGYKLLDEKPLGDIGTLIALVGVLVIMLKGIFLVIPLSTPTTKQPQSLSDESHPANAPPAFPSKEPPALLSAEPPSITEHTTKHLEGTPEDADLEATRTSQALYNDPLTASSQ